MSWSRRRMLTGCVAGVIMSVAACSSNKVPAAGSVTTTNSTRPTTSTTTSVHSLTSTPTSTAARSPTSTSTGAAPTPSVGAPKAVSLTVSASISCPIVIGSPGVTTVPADQLPQVTVTWSFTGADTVYLAIDNVDAPYQSDLAAAGSVNLPYVCPGPHTFYVVASRNGIRVVQHKTL